MHRRRLLRALRDGILALPIASVTRASAGGPSAGGSGAEEHQDVTLFLAGDVMTGRGIDQVFARHSDPAIFERYVTDARDYVALAERRNGPIPKPVDYDYVWGDALPIWQTRKPHVRIVNLETSVTTSDDYWASKGIHYRMHPGNVACLNAARIDCCVLANNHVMDWGYAGLEETLASLHDASIATAGAGRSLDEAARPARLSVTDKRNVLVFAVADRSSGVSGRWSAEPARGGVHLLPDLSRRSARRIAEGIDAARGPDDIVVVSIHWGGNWGYAVPEQQRRFARSLIDSGVVDIVHGHSSHHPKAIEFYHGKVIFYGCGDLVNDYEGIGGHEHYRPWLSPMYFVTVSAGSRQIDRVDIELMRMRRFRLQKASAEDRRWMRDKLNDYRDDFGTVVELDDEALVAGT